MNDNIIRDNIIQDVHTGSAHGIQAGAAHDCTVLGNVIKRY